MNSRNIDEDASRPAFRAFLAQSPVPKNLHDGLEYYLFDHILPGGFLQAVLANDLMLTCARADAVCREHLVEILAFLHFFAPPETYGSPERVLAWAISRDQLELPSHTCPICDHLSNRGDFEAKASRNLRGFRDRRRAVRSAPSLRHRPEATEI